MKKTLLLVLAGFLGLVVLAKATHLGSYVRTAVAQAKTEAKKSVPIKFELERIRQEIAGLDNEFENMIRPTAEYKVAIDRLRAEVQTAEANLGQQKDALLAATENLKNAGNNKLVSYGGHRYPAEQAKLRLAKDFESYKRLESHLGSQRKLLESKEAALRSSQEQLQVVISKKREFEVRVAQLEAEYEAQQVRTIGTDIKLNTHRATTIEQDLRAMEDRLAAEVEAAKLRTGNFGPGAAPANQRQNPAVDVDAIRAHLEGAQEAAAADNR